MANYFLLENFIPSESRENKMCIWCTQSVIKNKAHIFSKRIIKQSNSSNILKRSVCIRCNSNFGSSIENYLFKKTPLGYISDAFLSNEFTSLKWIPNYFWHDVFGTWIIVIHDNDAKEVLPPQLMINTDNKLVTFMEDDEEDKHFEMNKKLIKKAQWPTVILLNISFI